MSIDSAFTELISSDLLFSGVIFFLLFSIFYLSLTIAKFFEQKNTRLVIAFVLSLITVAPHFLGLPFDLVALLEALLADFSFFLLLILIFILVMGIFGIESEFIQKNGLLIFVIVFLIVLNLIVALMFPSVFPQFLSLSILAAILSAIDKRTSIAGYLLSTILLIYAALLYYNLADRTYVPGWIAWIGSDSISGTLVFILIFAIIIKWMFRK